jgi:hypothetical protein
MYETALRLADISAALRQGGRRMATFNVEASSWSDEEASGCQSDDDGIDRRYRFGTARYGLSRLSGPEDTHLSGEAVVRHSSTKLNAAERHDERIRKAVKDLTRLRLKYQRRSACRAPRGLSLPVSAV